MVDHHKYWPNMSTKTLHLIRKYIFIAVLFTHSTADDLSRDKCMELVPIDYRIGDHKCLLAYHLTSTDKSIHYSLDCEGIDSADQLSDAMDWIRHNKDTICGNTSSLHHFALQDVNIWKSNSSAVIQWIKSSPNSLVDSLTISQTFWSQIPNNLFSSWDQLKRLNLTNNGLQEFPSKTILSPNSRLISLDLSHNNLTSVDLNSRPLSSLRTILLSNNSLKSIKEFDHRMATISLSGNHWDCDNELVWLLKYATDPSRHVLDRDDIHCRTPAAAKDMKFAQRLSQLSTPVCGQCECTVLRNNQAMSVNCSHRRLSALPSSLPSKTKIVRMDSNDIKNISLSSAVALSEWRNVTYLHLNNNTIESFVGLEKTNLLKSLVALNVSHNRIREIPVYILDQLSHLDELYLSENPWRCDCHTVNFQTWLQNHFKSVKDVDNIKCAAAPPFDTKPRNGLYSEYFDKRFANRVLLRIPKSELCPQSRDPIEIFEIINWLLASVILLVIVKLIYDYFWQKRTGKLPEFFKLNVN